MSPLNRPSDFDKHLKELSRSFVSRCSDISFRACQSRIMSRIIIWKGEGSLKESFVCIEGQRGKRQIISAHSLCRLMCNFASFGSFLSGILP